MLTGLNFRLPFSEAGPTFPLSQLSTARHWQDEESMITERWQSGRSRRTRNAVGRKVPGVRIPPSPPSFAPGLRMARPTLRSTKFLPADIALLRRMPFVALAEEGLYFFTPHA